MNKVDWKLTKIAKSLKKGLPIKLKKKTLNKLEKLGLIKNDSDYFITDSGKRRLLWIKSLKKAWASWDKEVAAFKDDEYDDYWWGRQNE